MRFFKRIFKHPKPDPADVPQPVARVERRSTQRYAVNPKSPLKAVLSFIGRDTTGAQLSRSRAGWDWMGRLIDFSERGASMQLGAAALAARGDACELKLSLEDAVLEIPCHVTNIRVQTEGLIYGLKHDICDEATLAAYRQLLDVVALGTRLKLQFRKTEPDAIGYLVEQYASDRQSRLTVWRNQADRTVAAVEFLLRDCLVRAAEGHLIQYLSGADAATARRATPAKSTEILHRFQWVVPNLSPAVPADVRLFLQRFAN